MSVTLGFLEEKITSKNLLKEFQHHNYVLEIIEKEDQLSELDGMILSLTNKEKFPLLIDWLLTCKKKPSMFVWVFTTINLTHEHELLMKLGANEVVTESSILSLIVKNTFLRIDHIYDTKEKEKAEKGIVLNAKNQSVLINNSECPLTRKEYELLYLLNEQYGNCLTYNSLISKLWPGSSNEESYKLANVVFHLREKVKNSKEFKIKTVRSKGYMLVNIYG